MDKNNQNPQDNSAPGYSSPGYPSQHPINRAQQPIPFPLGYPQQYYGNPYGMAYVPYANDPAFLFYESRRSDNRTLARQESHNPGAQQQFMKAPEPNQLAYSDHYFPQQYHPAPPMDPSNSYSGYPPYSYPMAPYYPYASPAYSYYYPMPGLDPYQGYSPYTASPNAMTGQAPYPSFHYELPSYPLKNTYMPDQSAMSAWQSQPQRQSPAPNPATSKETVIQKKESQPPLAPPGTETRILPSEIANVSIPSQPLSKIQIIPAKTEQVKVEYKKRTDQNPPIETIKIRVTTPTLQECQENKEKSQEHEKPLKIERKEKNEQIEKKSQSKKSEESPGSEAIEESEEDIDSEKSEDSEIALMKLQRPAIMSEKIPDPIPNSMVLKIRPPYIFKHKDSQERFDELSDNSGRDFVGLGRRSDFSDHSVIFDKEKVDQMLNVQSKKVKTFWRGVNFTFPDTFKRCYEGRMLQNGDSHVTEVMDLSSKSLMTLQYLNRVDLKTGM